MRAELLAVAGLAVHVSVGSVAGDDGVEGLVAVLALEALAMPLATLGKDLLGGEDYSTATRAPLAGRSLDDRGVDHGGLRRSVSVEVRV